MESNGPPKSHKTCPVSRKKHKHDSNRDHDQGCGTWKMSFPENGIKMQDCDEPQEPQKNKSCNPEWHDEARANVHKEEESSPSTDTSNEICTDTESTPESSGNSGQTDPSAQLENSDLSCATEASSKLKVDIEQFMQQKKKIIEQIKMEDPELFAEFCSSCTGEPPWYSKGAKDPNNQPKHRSKQEIKQPSCKTANDKGGVPNSPKHRPSLNGSPQQKIAHTAPRSQSQGQRATPKKQQCAAPPPDVCAKAQVPRVKPAAKQSCAQPVKTHSKPRNSLPPVHNEPPVYRESLHVSAVCHESQVRHESPVHHESPVSQRSPDARISTPKESATCCPNANPKRKACIPTSNAPKITGDQKKDVEAKQTFAKIKKIELDTVLDRNVHDLSLDTPDRDPVLIASLMNSNIQIDSDPTETYSALVHPLGKNKLSATDVHHTDPGSMVPKQIPVANLNQLSAEVLDELEAIFKSQGIAYPADDMATAETRGLDVTQREPEKPKVKPLPPLSLFKCTLELQPLRVENFFQLRGTNSPSWYPGMMASFPDGRSDLRLIRSPSGLIKTAYTYCKP